MFDHGQSVSDDAVYYNNSINAVFYLQYWVKASVFTQT